MDKDKKPQETTIGSQVTLIGQMDTDRPMHIRGIYEGDLSVANLVFVEKCGMSSGNIVAEHVVVHGVVVGSVRATRVEIRSSGKVWGNVCAYTFYIEPGGFVRGQIITPARPGDTNWDVELPVNLATLPLQPMREDALDHLLEELETVAQKTFMPDDVLLRPQPLQVKRALARVADAKNWMILQLQLEYRALQEAFEEREALIALFQDETEQMGNGREASLVRQTIVLGNQLQRLRKAAVQRQQSLSRLQLELIETRLSLQAAQNEVENLRDDLNRQKVEQEVGPSAGVGHDQRYDDEDAAAENRLTTHAGPSTVDLAAIVAERDQATVELEEARDQIETLKQRLAHLQEEKATATKTVAQLQDTLEKAQGQKVDLAVRLSRARRTVEREDILTAKVAALRDALETSQRQKSDLEQTVERLTNERDVIRETQKQKMVNLASAMARSERLVSEQDDLREQIDHLQDTLAHSRLKTVDLEQTIAHLTQERDEARAIQAQEQTKEETSRQQSVLMQTIERLESERDAAYEEREKQETVMAGLQLDLNTALESVEQLMAKRDELRNALATAEREKERLAEKSKQITNERDMARAARERGQASLANLRQELDAAAARVQQLASERDTLREEIAHLRETAQTAEALQADLSVLREALAAAERERDALREEQEKEQEALAEAQDAARALQEQRQASLIELQADLSAALECIEALQSERDHLQEEAIQLRKSLGANEARRVEMAKQLALIAANQERESPLPADVTALHEALAISEHKRKALTEELKQVQQTSQALVEEQRQSDLRDLDERSDDTKAEIEQIVGERDRAQAKWEQAQASIAQLNADLKAARRRIVRLKDRLTEQEAGVEHGVEHGVSLKEKILHESNVHVAYCLRCRAQRLVSEVREIEMPNGQRAVKGRCAVCGAGLFSQIPEGHQVTQDLLAFLR